MTLNIDGAEFDYHTENAEKLTKDFTDYVLTDVPFFALQDELLYLMNKRNITKFRIPGSMTIDHQEHIFYFQVTQVKENKKLRTYHYLGIDLTKKEA
ncbi:DUF5960 family protein [Enterococcus pingfangensis]